MKLQATHCGRLYATRGRTVLAESGTGAFEPLGRLPNPTTGLERIPYQLRTGHPWKHLLHRIVGRFTTTNLWVLDNRNLLATVGRHLFVSHDGGATWDRRLELPPSSGLMGVLPPAVTKFGGDVFLGEYPLDDESPRVLRSRDVGDTWSVATTLPNVRHVHAVQVDPYTDDLWVTTGDHDPECKIGRLRGGELSVVGSGSQRWRAVELAFTPEYVLWGMDCVYADQNSVLRLPRDSVRDDGETPEPKPVTTVPGSVYFSEGIDIGGERWVLFSTAMEVGGDSTGPEGDADASSRAVVVGASSATNFEEWHVLARFSRSLALGDYVATDWIPTANGYVFMTSDPDRGVFLNAFNARQGDGDISVITPARFDEYQ